MTWLLISEYWHILCRAANVLRLIAGEDSDFYVERKNKDKIYSREISAHHLKHVYQCDLWYIRIVSIVLFPWLPLPLSRDHAASLPLHRATQTPGWEHVSSTPRGGAHNAYLSDLNSVTVDNFTNSWDQSKPTWNMPPATFTLGNMLFECLEKLSIFHLYLWLF